MPISKGKLVGVVETTVAPKGAATLVAVLMGAVSVLGLSLAITTPTFAFDPDKTFKADEEPRTILRYGYRALKDGKFDDAIGAFRLGAKRNDLASQWKLAEMLQHGSGIEQNHVAAHKLYTHIANRFAESAPYARDTPYVSHALVSLGKYALKGVEGTNIRRSPRIAEHYFYRAAALYKDPEAQFQLGKLYRSDVLGVHQPRSAIRWLGLAARKGHVIAQAELGQMLFYGEGVRRRPVRGLVYMARAASRHDLQNLRMIHDQAFAEASAEQRQEALRIVAELGVEGSSTDSIVPSVRPASQAN